VRDANNATIAGPQIRESWMSVDVAIVFALKEEFDYYRPQIPANRQPHVDPQTGRTFLVYDVAAPGGSYACATTFVGAMGPLDVALLTEYLLRTFEPRTVIVIGLAGSLSEDVRVGDVVIADEVHDYVQDGKVTPQGMVHGGRSYRPHVRLKNAIQYLDMAREAVVEALGRASVEDLEAAAPRDALDAAGDAIRRTGARIFVGPIASGPFVVADPAYGAWLRSLNRKCLAAEMESAGLMNAVYQHAGDERTLVIRAISDLGDERKTQLDRIRGGALRAVAMRNAIRLLQALMAIGELDRHPAAPAPAPGPAPAAVPVIDPAAAPRTAAAAPSTEQLLARLGERDPLICIPAADALATRDVDIAALLPDRSLGAVRLLARRRVIAAHAARAAPVLLDHLTRDAWPRAAAAAELFVPELGPDVARTLADGIARPSDVDHVRLRILALGRMAALDYAFKPAMLLGEIKTNEYLFDKWEYYCVVALARIFARSVAEPPRGFDPRQDAETAGRLYAEAMAASHAGSGDANRHQFERIWALAACGPIQADVAIARFLRADHEGLRVDGARILGTARLSRGVKPLIGMLDGNDRAAHHAAWALAQIGSPDALDALRRHGYAHDLALRAADLPEDWVCAQLQATAEPSHSLLRGAGLHRSAACRAAIERGLEASDGAVRGCAALALARLDGGAALPRLLRCHAEATERFERIFTSLALLTAAPERYPALAAELRDNLAYDSYMLDPFLIEDILAVLGATPGAEPVHAMWAHLYGPGRLIWHN
jgi:nucleoside phosphorylase